MLLDFTTMWQGIWDRPWFAPWIVESWHDFLAYFAFDIPVLVADPAWRVGVFAIGACCAFLMTWLAVAPTPRVARRAARMLATGVFLVPAALVVALQLEADYKQRLAEAEHGPRIVQSASPVVAQSAAKASADDEHTQPRSPVASSVSATAPPKAMPEVEVAAAPVMVPPPVVAAPAPAPPAAPASQAALNQAAVVPREPAPARASPTGAVAKVFYGTDRAVDPTAEGLDYSAVRAQRLIIGQALISIPTRAPSSDRPITVAATPRATGLTAVEIKAMAREDGLEAMVKQLAQSKRYRDHVLIFVPGFHMSFEAALARAAQIGADLGFDGALCVYSWPSAGRVARYEYDAQSARETLPYLKDFIRLAVGETGAKSVSLIGHGLGSQPLLEALFELQGTMRPDGPKPDVILAAPDVDAAVFGDRVASLAGHVGAITLYTAANDRALNLTRRYTGGIPRAGDMLEGGPLVLPGVVTVDVGTAGTDAVGLNTTGYVARSALLGDIAARLQAPQTPGSVSGTLETIPTPRGAYYRLMAAPVTEP